MTARPNDVDVDLDLDIDLDVSGVPLHCHTPSA
jgi:hypothetical protein